MRLKRVIVCILMMFALSIPIVQPAIASQVSKSQTEEKLLTPKEGSQLISKVRNFKTGKKKGLTKKQVEKKLGKKGKCIYKNKKQKYYLYEWVFMCETIPTTRLDCVVIQLDFRNNRLVGIACDFSVSTLVNLNQ